MKRKAVAIDPVQQERIAEIAAARGITEAQLVHDAVARYLDEEEPQPSVGNHDPLLEILGAVDDPDAPTDGSVFHDHYLYGIPKEALAHKAPSSGSR